MYFHDTFCVFRLSHAVKIKKKRLILYIKNSLKYSNKKNKVRGFLFFHLTSFKLPSNDAEASFPKQSVLLHFNHIFKIWFLIY
jgi:hypothetical protein